MQRDDFARGWDKPPNDFSFSFQNHNSSSGRPAQGIVRPVTSAFDHSGEIVCLIFAVTGLPRSSVSVFKENTIGGETGKAFSIHIKCQVLLE